MLQTEEISIQWLALVFTPHELFDILLRYSHKHKFYVKD